MLGTAVEMQVRSAAVGRVRPRPSRVLHLALILAVLGLAGVLLEPAAALGACDNWTNKSGGSWNQASNWSEGVPGPSTEACISKAGSYEVKLETGTVVEVKSLKLGASSGAQKLAVISTGSAYLRAGEELTIASAGTLALTSTGADAARVQVTKLKNNGAIAVEAGGGGARSLEGAITNSGAVTIGEGVALTVESSTLTNSSGGSISAGASGHLAVPGSSTFVQGAGATTGSEPVVLEGGTLEYGSVGEAESRVIARGYASSYLKSSIPAKQTLTVEGTCATGIAEVYVPEKVANAGTIVLTSGGSGCSREARMEVVSGKTLTNTGTIRAEKGEGGVRRLYGAFVNQGSVQVAAEAMLAQESGSLTNEGSVSLGAGSSFALTSTVFTNAAGSVSGSGSGQMTIGGSSTFVQGAGATTGSEPVVLEGGTLEYASVGEAESRVVARGYASSYLKSSIPAKQTLTVEGTCAAGIAEVYVPEKVANAGTIVLTSGGSGCSREARMEVVSGKTLTNTGTIRAEKGEGGVRRLYGAFVNQGSVQVAAEAMLAQESGSLTNEGSVSLGAGSSFALTSTVFTNAAGSVSGSGSGQMTIGGSSTFVQGAGATTGSEPVVLEGGTLEYAGSGAGTIVARGYYSDVTGALSSGQTLVVEGTCAHSTGEVYATEGLTNAGTIVLTSGESGCAREARVEIGSGKTLTNTATGVIKAEAGESGARRVAGGMVLNEGTIGPNSAVMTVESTRLTNGAGGKVSGSGSGHVLVSSGTFVQGAGATTGSEPVVLEGGTLEYAGSGAGTIVARGYYSDVTGALSSGQTLVVEGTCAHSTGEVYATEGLTNAGTIVLTSGESGCAREARVEIGSGKTLTNTATGVIKAEAGESGARRVAGGMVLNEGTIGPNSAVMTVESTRLTNGAGGKVSGSGSGHVLVSSGTFVQGAGATTGSEPVVLEGGTLEYAGSGAGTIVARGYYSDVTGALSSGQTLVVEGTWRAFDRGGVCDGRVDECWHDRVDERRIGLCA